MENFHSDEIAILNKAGFYWDATSREFFSDTLDYERGIYRDGEGGIIFRSRIWDEEMCQYEDEYENFGSVFEFIGYYYGTELNP